MSQWVILYLVSSAGLNGNNFSTPDHKMNNTHLTAAAYAVCRTNGQNSADTRNPAEANNKADACTSSADVNFRFLVCCYSKGQRKEVLHPLKIL
jgi:hypothetical protein